MPNDSIINPIEPEAPLNEDQKSLKRFFRAHAQAWKVKWNALSPQEKKKFMIIGIITSIMLLIVLFAFIRQISYMNSQKWGITPTPTVSVTPTPTPEDTPTPEITPKPTITPVPTLVPSTPTPTPGPTIIITLPSPTPTHPAPTPTTPTPTGVTPTNEVSPH